MNLTNLLFAVALFVLPLSTANAQTATAILSGSDTVRQGELLQLTFAFENVDAKDFKLPELVGLTVVGGPSRQSSMSIMNGQRSSSSAFVYRVVAEQAGLAVVPEVIVLNNEEEIKTEALTVFISEDPEYVPLQENGQSQRTPEQPKKKKRPTIKM
ncbi:MAG: BatD family protein [Saprospiraceae bacterium]